MSLRTADRWHLIAMGVGWIVWWALFFSMFLKEARQRGAVSTDEFVSAVVLTGFMAAIVNAVIVAIPLRVVLNLVLSDRRRTHRAETIVLTCLLLVFFGYFWEVGREHRSLAPPRGVATLAQFADVMSAPRSLQLVRYGDRNYIIWTGERTGPFDIPSGPSCYIFDDNGELVDWTSETGENGPVDKFDRSSEKHQELTVEEALKITSE